MRHPERTKTGSEPAAPSPRVVELIKKMSPPEQHSTVEAMVATFHWSPQPLIDERIHLDIVEASEGKLELVSELLELARTDWRDLIVTTEYCLEGEKLVPNERGRRRLEESTAKVTSRRC